MVMEVAVQAQPLPSVMVSGLSAPMKMLALESGVVLVAEFSVVPVKAAVPSGSPAMAWNEPLN